MHENVATATWAHLTLHISAEYSYIVLISRDRIMWKLEIHAYVNTSETTWFQCYGPMQRNKITNGFIAAIIRGAFLSFAGIWFSILT